MKTWELLLNTYSFVMSLVANHSETDRYMIKTYLDMLIAQTAVADDSIDPDKFGEILEFLDK